ncbi:MAG TPA: hypothetical protein PKO06_23530, partial [Candidatus Ozemobacteraceae bacterium]|nr:hypothetical protein [Candidatus Ozemobacteraceae bacterium]
MNRRQFLHIASTCLGAGGIAGMLLTDNRGHPLQSSHQAQPSSREQFDAAEARRTFQHLENAGFTPREALYWERSGANRIRCTLCPTFCELRPYERGHCRVRFGLENRLVTVVYGKPCSVAIDPIEKKPVFHLLPGSTSFSFATAGCLLRCRYCQNW